jgi:hypothetical protein
MINLKQISGIWEAFPEERGLHSKGAILMAMQVCWLDNLAKAQETAKKTNKPILLDFFNSQ